MKYKVGDFYTNIYYGKLETVAIKVSTLPPPLHLSLFLAS